MTFKNHSHRVEETNYRNKASRLHSACSSRLSPRQNDSLRTYFLPIDSSAETPILDPELDCAGLLSISTRILMHSACHVQIPVKHLLTEHLH